MAHAAIGRSLPSQLTMLHHFLPTNGPGEGLVDYFGYTFTSGGFPARPGSLSAELVSSQTPPSGPSGRGACRTGSDRAYDRSTALPETALQRLARSLAVRKVGTRAHVMGWNWRSAHGGEYIAECPMQSGDILNVQEISADS